MPKLIRWRDGRAEDADDSFTSVDDDQPLPPGDIVVSLARFQGEGEWLLGQQGRRLGVRLGAGEAVESLAGSLPRLTMIALEFPKFRDGRPYSAAMILRSRFGYVGEVRAVGEVLREQAGFLVRAGFDAFEPADGASAADWRRIAGRYRHVYQRAADDRAPAFAERLLAATPRLAA